MTYVDGSISGGTVDKQVNKFPIKLIIEKYRITLKFYKTIYKYISYIRSKIQH